MQVVGEGKPPRKRQRKYHTSTNSSGCSSSLSNCRSGFGKRSFVL
jgi:hypothetical protein